MTGGGGRVGRAGGRDNGCHANVNVNASCFRSAASSPRFRHRRNTATQPPHFVSEPGSRVSGKGPADLPVCKPIHALVLLSQVRTSWRDRALAHVHCAQRSASVCPLLIPQLSCKTQPTFTVLIVFCKRGSAANKARGHPGEFRCNCVLRDPQFMPSGTEHRREASPLRGVARGRIGGDCGGLSLGTICTSTRSTCESGILVWDASRQWTQLALHHPGEGRRHVARDRGKVPEGPQGVRPGPCTSRSATHWVHRSLRGDKRIIMRAVARARLLPRPRKQLFFACLHDMSWHVMSWLLFLRGHGGCSIISWGLGIQGHEIARSTAILGLLPQGFFFVVLIVFGWSVWPLFSLGLLRSSRSPDACLLT